MSETFEPRRIIDPYARIPSYLCDAGCPQYESTEDGPGRGCRLMPDEWQGLDGYCGPGSFAQRMIREKMGM